ncbi:MULTISPECIES: hypothetical protein [unclassified Bradyrhizobium]|uniref:hypothetical protein n=1 Tax=unclassified Bradyrhizobium TaxID=2631580 RepID=UPI002305583A|nr:MULTISPECIES: hypothetical protein [unclassified Bradyrhizobium]
MAEALAHPASLQPVTKLTIRQQRKIVPSLRKQLQEWSEVGRHPNQRRHTLVSEPPIREIDRDSFLRGVERFLRNDIRHIAENPEEYSDFVSQKAERVATVAGSYANTYDDPNEPARFYSYRLGDEIVGLLRAGGPARIKGDHFQQQFGRNDITSVVDLR